MKIIFLGTGAASPNLKRNLSSVFMHWEGESFLFDCGEACQIQLRYAGIKPGKFRQIFISHLHGDHILGLMGLLMTLELSGRELPLVITGPPGLREFIEVNRRLLHTRFSFPLEIYEIDKETVFKQEQFTIWAMPLKHRIFTLGYAFLEKDKPGKFNLEKARSLGIPEGPLYGKLQRGENITLPSGEIIYSSQIVGPPVKGRKLVYCVDTRPCNEALTLAQYADILIYDGTFLPKHLNKAQKSGHSTVEEAATLAREAKVRRLILTHISSRNQSLKEILQPAQAIFPNTTVAEDLMVIEVPLNKGL